MDVGVWEAAIEGFLQLTRSFGWSLSVGVAVDFIRELLVEPGGSSWVRSRGRHRLSSGSSWLFPAGRSEEFMISAASEFSCVDYVI